MAILHGQWPMLYNKLIYMQLLIIHSAIMTTTTMMMKAVKMTTVMMVVMINMMMKLLVILVDNDVDGDWLFNHIHTSKRKSNKTTPFIGRGPFRPQYLGTGVHKRLKETSSVLLTLQT